MPRWPKRKLRPGMDQYGRTPLWHRALAGDLAGIRAELAGGADPSFGDDVDYSPLHAAVQGGRVEAVKLLLDAGADPNKVDNHGNGPLWTAVLTAPQAARAELIAVLLTAGADPDRKNRHGRSPREMAVTIGHGLEEPFASGAVKQAEPGAAP